MVRNGVKRKTNYSGKAFLFTLSNSPFGMLIMAVSVMKKYKDNCQ